MFLSATWPGPCIAATLSFIRLGYNQPGSFVLPLGFNEKCTVRESPAQPRFCFLEFQLCMVSWSPKIVSEKSQRWMTCRFDITLILSSTLKPRRPLRTWPTVAQRLPPVCHPAVAVATSLPAAVSWCLSSGHPDASCQRSQCKSSDWKNSVCRDPRHLWRPASTGVSGCLFHW